MHCSSVSSTHSLGESVSESVSPAESGCLVKLASVEEGQSV